LGKGSKKINLNLPLKRSLIQSIITVFKEAYKADKIVVHGNPLLFFWALFPFFLRKTAWVIYGGADMYLDNKSIYSIQNQIKRFVIKRIAFHITHIKGDSDWCNSFYQSKARFFDNPIYLSNIIEDITKSDETDLSFPKKPTIMIGNSFDPSNRHLELFDWLKPLCGNVNILCPLAYGSNLKYKAEVIEAGKRLFKDDFMSIENFMPIDTYKEFLNKNVDIALFNHHRQEAMGITLQLIAMGKPVFVYPATSSYQALKDKGIQVLNNEEIQLNPFVLLAKINVSNSIEALKIYYSETSLLNAWKQFYAA
jgi:hypothetical protein